MRKNISVLSLIFFLALLFSCGLDVYYFIEPPINSSAIQNPTDPAQQFFTFTTQDSINTDTGVVGNVKFLGTQVYYKIYDDLDILLKQKNQIDSVNSEYSENGYNKLLSLNFQKLNSNPYSDPLIKKSSTNSNQKITIVLQENSYNQPTIEVDDTKIGIPLRYDLSTFDTTSGNGFSGEDTEEKTDSSENSENYYVLLYAVSVGSVNLSQRVYSSILSLGYLEI